MPVRTYAQTKAYRYFLTAAEAELDGDSLTNAAFCLLHGIGTDKDLVRAAALYDRAARKFGSMSAVVTLASMHMEVR
jgi:TPR repeat protein